MKEDLFYELSFTEDGYVIGRHNHDEADSVSIVGYTEESKHARLFVAAPKLLEALQQCIPHLREQAKNDGHAFGTLQLVNHVINKATGETK